MHMESVVLTADSAPALTEQINSYLVKTVNRPRESQLVEQVVALADAGTKHIWRVHSFSTCCVRMSSAPGWSRKARFAAVLFSALLVLEYE